VSWVGAVAVALLLLAGLPRLVWGSRSQRALATALCGAALATALEFDEVEQLLAGRGLAAFGTLLQCLFVTLAAGAAFGMAKQVSPTPLRPRISPAAAGLPVAAVQGLLFGLSGVAGAPPTGSLFIDHVGRPAVVALWLVTAAGPVAAGAVLLPVLCRYAPGLPQRRARFAVDCTVAGSVAVGLAGLAMGLQLVAVGIGRADLAAVAAAAAPLAPVGLAVVACGVLAVRVVTTFTPLLRWLSSHRALRKLDGLAAELVAAAPEWDVSTVEDRWAVRNPGDQLYRRVIAIRDASWTLFGLVDNEVITRALDFARSRAGFAGEAAVAALAEACWLRYAVEARARGAQPFDATAAHFPERIPEPPGSLHEEAAFLVGLARMWRHPLVDEFLRDCFRDDRCAHLHSA
jgi:hypothetical protein